MLESILELKIFHDLDMEKKSSKFGVDACIRIIKENGSDFFY